MGYLTAEKQVNNGDPLNNRERLFNSREVA
jgi:hypothetical protein